MYSGKNVLGSISFFITLAVLILYFYFRVDIGPINRTNYLTKPLIARNKFDLWNNKIIIWLNNKFIIEFNEE